MYEPTKVAEAIKSLAKARNIQLKEMLQTLGLNKNTLSNMYNGSMLKGDSLARIADYLDCSVDYLLGRTQEQKNTPTIVGESDEDKQKLLHNYEKLNDTGKNRLLEYSDDLVASGKYDKSDFEDNKMTS